MKDCASIHINSNPHSLFSSLKLLFNIFLQFFVFEILASTWFHWKGLGDQLPQDTFGRKLHSYIVHSSVALEPDKVSCRKKSSTKLSRSSLILGHIAKRTQNTWNLGLSGWISELFIVLACQDVADGINLKNILKLWNQSYTYFMEINQKA